MQSQEQSTATQFLWHGPVLFYDGECGLCAFLVRRLARADHAGRLRFAALQGAIGQAYLRLHRLPTADFSSLVFASDIDDEAAAPLQRTDGAIAALRALGGGAEKWAGFLAWFPQPFRNAGYRVVARIRYRLFGHARYPSCPAPDLRDRFLDQLEER